MSNFYDLNITGEQIQQLINSVPNKEDRNKILDYIEYKITSKGQVQILSCNPSISGYHVIPDMIEGYPVVSLSTEAFKDCTELISITIPDSVYHTSLNVFENCTNLQYVKLSSNLGVIETRMFRGCSSLKYIDIPSSVTAIGSSAFAHCTSLKSIVLPEGLAKIQEQSFWECVNLVNINIPNSVSTISGLAFQDCTGLTSIKLPNGTKYINIETFSGCTGLTSVVIPKTLKVIGKNSFLNCTSLADIYYEGSVGDWNIILEDSRTNSGGNSEFFSANLHYNQELTTKEYVDNVIELLTQRIIDLENQIQNMS